MSDSSKDDILSRATDAVRTLFEEAFEAGRNDMRRELATLLMGSDTAHRALPASRVIQDHGRATAGTVKPAIKALIKNAAKGIRASEIVSKTGFKVTSVRGTLATLRAEGFAEREGELWVLSERKSPQAGASGPSQNSGVA